MTPPVFSLPLCVRALCALPLTVYVWLQAESDEDKLFFGGRWSAESLFEEIQTLREERDEARAALAQAKL